MHYEWKVLDAGPIALDGGGMFGVVPRVLWQKAFPPDEQNRITLGHNCLLLRGEDGKRLVLIETGSGDKFGEKERAIFGLSDRSVHTALAEENVDPGDITDVIVTHLHFDHAGGLTRLQNGEPVVAFRNARIHVQEREYRDARESRSVMTRTYLPENILPIEPQLKVKRGDGEVMPGVRVFAAPGHTWGQQAVSFNDTSDDAIVFVPDVMPTVAHVGRAYSLAYDVEPYTTTLTKKTLLRDAVQYDLTLVLDHEPSTPVVKGREDGNGWYILEPAEAP